MSGLLRTGGRIMEVTKEKQDIVEKEFIGFPDITADTINVLLYKGRRLIKAEDLWAGPTETVYQTPPVGTRKAKDRIRNQFEDVCKYEMTDGHIRIMYLIANQTRTDGKMLLRKASYTGGAYREQYEGKTQDIYPVIEFVLYWGVSRWRSSRDLHRFFRRKKTQTDVPAEVWRYIDSLQLHVYEMRHLPKEVRELFQSDMRIVVDYLAEGRSYRSDRKIVHKAALIRMIRVLSGDSDIEDVEEWLEKQQIREEDEITVCELFDQYERKGREEGEIVGRREGRKEGEAAGRREGRKEGRKEGEARRLVTDIENAMQFFQVTLEKACEGLGTTVGRYEEAKKLL